MAYNVLRQAKAFMEATPGTPGTVTRNVYFRDGGHNQDMGTIIPAEGWANYTAHRRSSAGLETNGFTFGGDATFQDMPFWLNLHTVALATGSVTDTSAYTWTFLPVHTSNTLKSATLEFSYADLLATVGWKVPGCYGDTLSITWKKGGIGGEETGVMFQSSLMTAYGATQVTAHTASLSDRTQTSALGTGTKVYVDTTTIGTTADTNVTEVTFTVNNQLTPRFALTQDSVAAAMERPKPRVATLTMQRYFANKTELDTYLIKTPRKIRVLTEGAVVGAATAKNTIQLDFVGVQTAHDVAEVDGLIMANITLEGQYDSTLASDYKVVVINSILTLATGV